MAIGVKVKKANFTSVPEVIIERTNRLPYNPHPLNSFLRNLLTLTSSILSLTTLGKQIGNSCAFKKTDSCLVLTTDALSFVTRT